MSEQEQRKAIDVELKAGHVSLHHGMIAHGSRPNRSLRRRCGLAMVYIPTHVGQVENSSLVGKWNAVLGQGQDREGHFECPPHSFPLRMTASAAADPDRSGG